MKSEQLHHFKSFSYVLFIIIGFYLLLGENFGAGKITLHNAISDRALYLVDETLKKELLIFASVSTIKAAVALVEGSSVGVGFELEVGDLVQPVYDYIDFVWRLFLYATLLLTFYKLTLESGILFIGIQIIGTGFLLWGLGGIWKTRVQLLNRWAKRLFWFGLVIAYAVPVVLLGADYLSTRYTEPLKQETGEKMSHAGLEFQKAKDEFLSLKEKISLLHPGESIDQIRNTLVDFTESIREIAWNSMSFFLYYLALLLFDLLLLPILLALFIYFCFVILTEKVKLAGAV